MALILSEPQIAELDSALVELLQKADAKCALLVDQDGKCLVRQGQTRELDTDGLAALIAGSFASTRAMAALVGESEFSVLFHQGEKDHIHNILVDDDTILAALFDSRTTIGMVRLYSKEAAKRIRAALRGARAQQSGEPSPAADSAAERSAKETVDETDRRIEELFESDKSPENVG